MNHNLEEYNFYLWTSKTPPIKYLIELLRDLLTEGNLECYPEYIKLQAVDPSRDVLIHSKLNADKFEEYHCPEHVILGLNMEDLFKIIKNMENTDTLKLFVKKNNVNKLGIETYCKEENTCDTTYINYLSRLCNAEYGFCSSPFIVFFSARFFCLNVLGCPRKFLKSAWIYSFSVFDFSFE